MRSGVAMAKKAPQRVTCWNASKCCLFAVPGVALLPKSVAKSRKITENLSKFDHKNGHPGSRNRKIDTSSIEAAK